MGNDAKITLVIAAMISAAIAGFFLVVGYGQEVVVSVEGEPVANLQLMHVRSVDLMIGLGAGIISAIFAMGALVVGGLERD